MNSNEFINFNPEFDAYPNANLHSNQNHDNFNYFYYNQNVY